MTTGDVMGNPSKVGSDDYIGFLIGSQTKFTCTEAARTEPETDDASHDAYARFLDRIPNTTHQIWVEAEPLVRPGGILVVDDSVIDKPYSEKIELVSHMWSGKHHAVVKGIDFITILWTNGKRIVPTDVRVYNKKDGKTKNDHFRDLVNVAYGRKFSPEYVAFDSWYASIENLKLLRRLQWEWITRLESDRLVNPDEKGNVGVSTISIPDEGRIVHLKAYGFVKVFRIAVKEDDIQYWATSNLKMKTKRCRELKDESWKIEEFHRGVKQTCGIEGAQVRKENEQRNHINLAVIAFLRLEHNRIRTGLSWYETKLNVVRGAIRFFRSTPRSYLA